MMVLHKVAGFVLAGVEAWSYFGEQFVHTINLSTCLEVGLLAKALRGAG
jgi:hypothetical protein